MKKLTPENERKIRDIMKGAPGPELVLERRGQAFTFDMDIPSRHQGEPQQAKKSSDAQGEWRNPKRPFRQAFSHQGHRGAQPMEVDICRPSYYCHIAKEDEEAGLPSRSNRM